MKLGLKGLTLIQNSEALYLVAYPDTGGVWTIGWGHTKGVKKGDMCTRAQAVQWLEEDTGQATMAVNAVVDVPLTQNQFDALVSFTFNLGAGAFAGSTLLRKLNAGDASASIEFDRWVYDNGVVLNGLIKRRAAERALFEKA